MNGLEELFEGGKVLEDFFEHLDTVDFDLLSDEYKYLFVGPGVIRAPMWSSFYTDEKSLLFGDTTFEARKIYARAGKEYVNKNKEPEDHLLIELEFVRYLLQSQLQALQEEKKINAALHEVYIDMVTKHMLEWIPQFVQRIEKHGTNPLYIGAAKLLQTFLDIEVEANQII